MPRHDAQGTAKTPFNGPLKKPKLKWNAEMDYWVGASPVIGQNGAIYVAEWNWFFSLKPNTTTNWFIELKSSGTSGNGWPAVDSRGVVYIRDYDTILHALRESDKGELWSAELGKGRPLQPIIGADGTIYVHNDRNLVALDPTSGDPKWTGDDQQIYSGINFPVVLSPDGQRLYFNAYDRAKRREVLMAVNSQNGGVVWESDVAARRPAVGADGTIYACQNFEGDDHYLVAVDPANGKEKWTSGVDIEFHASMDHYPSQPAIDNDRKTIYLATDANDVFAIADNGTTGKRKWKKTLPEIEIGWVGASADPVVDGRGTVYVTADGNLYAFDPERGDINWQLGDEDGPSSLSSSAVIGSDGTLYVGHARGIAAYQEEAAPMPPSIRTQPQSQAVTAGGNVTFSVAAEGTPPLTYQWQKNGVNISGATGDKLTLNNVQSSNAGDYTVVVNNAVSPPATSSKATLTVTAAPTRPSIASQPQSKTATAGDSVTFSVTAAGTAPFTYQWQKNGQNILGATSPTLVLSNVQAADAGDYRVIVTNAAGPTNSATATLTVNQPATQRVVRVGSGSGLPGAVVTLPIELVALGNENTIGFSIVFDPAVLTYQTLVLGSGVGSGTQLVLNTSQTQNGRLGVLVGLQSGRTLSAGTRQIAVLSLRIAASPITARTATINFGDQPVAREVVSAGADTLAASYAGGTVEISVSFEADVAPRPNGDGQLRAADWALMGLFAGGLTNVTAGSEFMRADCAPRTSRGDGAITASDWTQAGRYVAGLDTPPQAAGGPSQAVVQRLGGGSRQIALHGSAGTTGRSVRVVSVDGQPGGVVQVPVELASLGNENTIGFSLVFDPAALTYESAANGSALPASAALILNTNQAPYGKLGVLLGLGAGQVFSAGPRQLLVLSFRVANQVSGASTALSFEDDPVARETVSAAVEVLDSQYLGGTVTLGSSIQPLLSLNLYAGLTIRGTVGATYQIQAEGELNQAGSWTPLGNVKLTNAIQLWVDTTQPADLRNRFYRAVLAP